MGERKNQHLALRVERTKALRRIDRAPRRARRSCADRVVKPTAQERPAAMLTAEQTHLRATPAAGRPVQTRERGPRRDPDGLWQPELPFDRSAHG